MVESRSGTAAQATVGESQPVLPTNLTIRACAVRRAVEPSARGTTIDDPCRLRGSEPRSRNGLEIGNDRSGWRTGEPFTDRYPGHLGNFEPDWFICLPQDHGSFDLASDS